MGIRAVITLLIYLVLVVPFSSVLADITPPRPNVIIIQADDQTPAMVEKAMPFTWTEIFLKGRRYTKYYATTPQCCPSRISLLTGKFASEHKVLWNGARVPDDLASLVMVFRKHSYQTAHLGKFTNSWSGQRRPEYDFWLAPIGTNRNKEVNVTYIKNETKTETTGHHLMVLQQLFEEFLAGSTGPFIAFLNPFAPHSPGTPLPEHKGLFHDEPLPQAPSFLEKDLSDKPEWLQAYAAQGRRIQKLEKRYQAQLRASRSLDTFVEGVVTALRSKSLLDITYIIYLADNGLQYGEHGLIEKSVPYEESIRVPLALRGPTIQQGEDTRLAANIDILPTILSLLGLPHPKPINGINLLSEEREHLFLEGGYRSHVQGQERWAALHTGEEVVIRTHGQRSEYYDLRLDPYQQQSQFDRAPKDLVKMLDSYIERYAPFLHHIPVQPDRNSIN
jgi:N-acetylglucosamine-6-sulfatase